MFSVDTLIKNKYTERNGKNIEKRLVSKLNLANTENEIVSFRAIFCVVVHCRLYSHMVMIVALAGNIR